MHRRFRLLRDRGYLRRQDIVLSRSAPATLAWRSCKLEYGFPLPQNMLQLSWISMIGMRVVGGVRGGLRASGGEAGKKAFRKRGLFTSRPKMVLRSPTLQRLVQCAKEAGAVEEGMLYIAAYAFLLRVPSEGLPITICMGSTDVQASAAMYFANGSVYLA